LEECGILGVLEQDGKGRAGKHKRISRSTITMGVPIGSKLHA